MYHVHMSGAIEKVTNKQLIERDKQQKDDKLQGDAIKKTELEKWHEQRPQDQTVDEWSKEFGKVKQEEQRQREAKQKQQQMSYRR